METNEPFIPPYEQQESSYIPLPKMGGVKNVKAQATLRQYTDIPGIEKLSDAAYQDLFGNKKAQPLLTSKRLVKAVGLQNAFFISRISYWQKKGQGTVYDGVRYIFCTYEQWSIENFPYIAAGTIRKAFDRLIEQGLVRREYLTQSGFDQGGGNRTSWWSLHISGINQLYNKLFHTEADQEHTVEERIKKIVQGIEALCPKAFIDIYHPKDMLICSGRLASALLDDTAAKRNASKGLKRALVLTKLAYLLRHPMTNSNIREGHRWVFYGVRKLHQEQMNYIPESTLGRLLKDLEEMGVLIIDKSLNKKAYDKTAWYTLHFGKLNEFYSSRFGAEILMPSVFSSNKMPSSEDSTGWILRKSAKKFSSDNLNTLFYCYSNLDPVLTAIREDLQKYSIHCKSLLVELNLLWEKLPKKYREKEYFRTATRGDNLIKLTIFVYLTRHFQENVGNDRISHRYLINRYLKGGEEKGFLKMDLFMAAITLAVGRPIAYYKRGNGAKTYLEQTFLKWEKAAEADLFTLHEMLEYLEEQADSGFLYEQADLSWKAISGVFTEFITNLEEIRKRPF